MWTLDCFKKLRKKCRDRSCGGTEFYTYSRSTQIRVALLAADFFVGHGCSSGLKTETTAAASCWERLRKPLDNQWLKRWKNSHRPYPFNTLETDFALIQNQILLHPQFRES